MKKRIKTILLNLLLLVAGMATHKNVQAQTCTVNLLIAYTDNAAAGLLGNQTAITKIKEAVQGLNTAYTNSQVTHQVTLVRTVRLNSFETNCFVNDLNNFQANGYINTLRDKYHADIAALIIANADFCGLPYLDDTLATANIAYCAVNYKCMVGNYALSHQIAHLYGCSHYIEEASPLDKAPFKYGHAFKWDLDDDEEEDAATTYSTILGQGDADFCGTSGVESCNIVPYFSNPAITYNGVALGIAGVHNSAQVLNENAATIGAFKLVPANQLSIVDTIRLYDVAIASARDSLGTGQYYTIGDTANVRFEAGSRIILNPGFTVNEGARFETFVENTTNACGNGPLSRMAQGNGYYAQPAVKAPATAPNKTGDETVAVYPNPSNGVFTITINGIAAEVLEVYNLAGVRLKREVLKNKTTTSSLNLTGYNKGLYMLHILSKGQRIIRKIVIE